MGLGGEKVKGTVATCPTFQFDSGHRLHTHKGETNDGFVFVRGLGHSEPYLGDTNHGSYVAREERKVSLRGV